MAAGAVLFLVALVVGLYFLPTIVAKMRGHQNTMAIFMLNLLLGWSIIGWVGAMVWSCTAVQTDRRDVLA